MDTFCKSFPLEWASTRDGQLIDARAQSDLRKLCTVRSSRTTQQEMPTLHSGPSPSSRKVRRISAPQSRFCSCGLLRFTDASHADAGAGTISGKFAGTGATLVPGLVTNCAGNDDLGRREGGEPAGDRARQAWQIVSDLAKDDLSLRKTAGRRASSIYAGDESAADAGPAGRYEHEPVRNVLNEERSASKTFLDKMLTNRKGQRVSDSL